MVCVVLCSDRSLGHVLLIVFCVAGAMVLLDAFSSKRCHHSGPIEKIPLLHKINHHLAGKSLSMSFSKYRSGLHGLADGSLCMKVSYDMSMATM